MKKLLLALVFVLSGCGMVEDLSTSCGSDIEVICKGLFGENTRDIEELDDRVTIIEEKLEQLDSLIQVLELNQDLNETEITQLQAQADALQIDVTELESQDSVVEYIDPCGDNPGKYDEIILKTSSGRLIAYFEDGGKRFLSELTPGNYQTTDHQKCNFTVDSDLNVID